MKLKAVVKVSVDVVMTVLMLIQTAYHMTDSRIHEWLGTLLFVLFIFHHILNLNWYKSLFKGRYTTARILYTVVNLLFTAVMIGMLISGMILSQVVFEFLGFRVSRLGRRLHMLSTAWGFVLISMHLGFHWSRVVGAAGKLIKRLKINTVHSVALARTAAGLASVYGIRTFVARQMGEKMLLRIEFAYFDFGESAVRFFSDSLAIMCLFACAGYYAAKLLKTPAPT